MVRPAASTAAAILGIMFDLHVEREGGATDSACTLSSTTPEIDDIPPGGI